MRPIDVPAGTTLPSFLEQVLPREHRAHVPAGEARTPIRVAVRVEGEGGGDWSLVVRGPEIEVSRGEARDAALFITADVASVQRLLEDATGPGELLPDVPDAASIVPLTDPRLLRRLLMMQGTVKAQLTGLAGAPSAIGVTISTQPPSKPDKGRNHVAIEVPLKLYRELIAFLRRPEEALSDVNVRLTGNRMVAMQAALALAILWPARK